MADAPTTLVILGASGDLTRRLLLPGLGTLLSAEPTRRVRVVGADRVDLSQEDWQTKVRDAFAEAGLDTAVAEPIAADSRYLKTDVLDEAQVRSLLAEAGEPLVLYFALPPAVTVQACALLEKIGVPRGTRLALEKPFGNDLESARELNRQLLRVVPENDIFRIDHFLGVNTILNLIGIRFANRLLQPIWTSEHIEKVEIVYDESLALEGRAGYYDKAGALLDMTQSHLLEILAFFAMEPPATMHADEVRGLKAQVLRATHAWGHDPARASRRARYTAGSIEGRSIPDYVAEEGVEAARHTETLSELVVQIDNLRWSGVPFILRSGKAIGDQRKEVVVTFRPPAHVPTGLEDNTEPDRLVLQLKPGAVDVELSMNAEGNPFELEQKELHAELGKPRMLPYGEILGAILDADPLLTIRGDEAEELWRIVEPVLAAWRANKVPLQDYAAGSDGPAGWGTVPRR
ncbi:glucose-6-phosphate dehydrogenase [Ornithinimicrobium tianjinense]|uniref:Glucose-6-phosphate 1-dehydrogenase n=1 Tax=Ornithinimicrobium tianjinense TaxID=1195761 RepID=A0A917BV06_9MICO|nr:glucose-6-phosphate dehydrogenase [Ornithinimicrobium tianjinense]GGF57759.1 glucose-6-phosphate 1-dehydrogenase [Ornithinimicrobium tianjinense]